LPSAWWARPAVAAWLRQRDSLLATADALNKSLRDALDHQAAEIKRLKESLAVQTNYSMRQLVFERDRFEQGLEEIAALRAEINKVKGK